MFFSNVATKPSFQLQPTLNQRYAATEREQTRPDASLFFNVFGIFRGALPAHNGLVAGSSPAGPTNNISDLSTLIFSTPSEIPTGSGTTSAKITKSSQWHLRQAGRARRQPLTYGTFRFAPVV